MIREYKLKSARIENRPVFIFSVIFIVVLLMAICAVSVLLLNELNERRSTAPQAIPVLLIPSALPPALPPASPPAAMLANQFSTYIPIILSEQIWKVINIESLGYELDGQRYDLATFTRIDGQDTVQGYCINRGWDVPGIGTEYLLNAEGIFVPLSQSDVDPIQRFLRIQP